MSTKTSYRRDKNRKQRMANRLVRRAEKRNDPVAAAWAAAQPAQKTAVSR